ncbi:MAG: hypothetical protein AAF962_27855 [Actinomycetota bacterium]
MRRPERLNAAGTCTWCGVTDCTNSLCRRVHAIVPWRLCSTCEGAGFCRYCCGGLVPDRLDPASGLDQWAVLRLGYFGHLATVCWCDEVGCVSPECGVDSVRSDRWYGSYPETMWKQAA